MPQCRGSRVHVNNILYFEWYLRTLLCIVLYVIVDLHDDGNQLSYLLFSSLNSSLFSDKFQDAVQTYCHNLAFKHHISGTHSQKTTGLLFLFKLAKLNTFLFAAAFATFSFVFPFSPLHSNCIC